jgi:hypothetical protein
MEDIFIKEGGEIVSNRCFTRIKIKDIMVTNDVAPGLV